MNTGMPDITSLGVFLHGRRIGAISRLAGERQIFSFDQRYVDDANRPTLSLSWKNASGALITAPQITARRVPPFFSNLLPEGHLRTYLAGRAGVSAEREFFLLASLGADMPGAITVAPVDPAHPDHANYDAEFPEPTAGRQRGMPPLRFSLAGVQLKFSAIMESHGGLTIPAEGLGGSWIVKLPSQTFASVSENEFAMLELARAIGIPVPRIRLIPVAEIDGLPAPAAAINGQALAVERFDRAPDGTRIHMEDFAQVFGVFPENKYKSVSYANIARVLWAETGEQGAYDFVRRLTFSVLIGNADMHLKNWSILYPDGRTPALSPAYDFVSTLPYIHNDQLALTLGGSRNMLGIEAVQIRRFAEKAGLPLKPLLRIIPATIEAVVENWRTLPSKELLPPAIRNLIAKQIETAAAETVRDVMG